MITLDTISRFAGTGKMQVNAQGTGFESVGILQRLKSFFNIGDARAKNQETMRAITTAVFSDRRFLMTQDLREHAELLLDEVSTDRAIDAAQIKSIVKKLEDLASGSQVMMDERVDLHLAAGEIPQELRAYTSKYTDQVATIAKQQANRPGAGGATGMVDVADVVRDVADHCRAALEVVSGLPDSNTKALKEFVGKHLDSFVVNRDGTLRSFQAIGDGAEFCRLASRGARQWLHEDSVRWENEVERATPYEMAAVEFLAEVKTPVPPALYAKVEQAVVGYAQHVSPNAFLGTASHRPPTADEIRTALTGIAQHMLANPIRNDDGTTLFDYDATAFVALGRYEAKLVALRLPPNVSAAICEKLNAQSAAEALEKAFQDALLAARP